MANIEKIIPFIMHFAAGVYGKDGEILEESPEIQFEHARRRGWSDDPDDPGGATMIDVTLSTYADYRKRKSLGVPSKSDLKNMTYSEWIEILKTMYWDKWRADEINSQGLANLLVDCVWASGTASIKGAQRVIGVKPDGVVGRQTIAALNASDSESLFIRLRTYRARYYRRCSGAWKYLNGWLRRLDSIRYDGSFLIYGKIIGKPEKG